MIITKRMAIDAYNEMINVDFMLDEKYKGFLVGTHKAAVAFVLCKLDLSNQVHFKIAQLISSTFKVKFKVGFSEKQMTHKEVKTLTEKIKVGELGRFFSCFPWSVD